ncbi:MAG: hypothetical protein EZS28_007513 [Streblomastix strix]|uniref:Flavodoxin-like domain-containing protein n=1 Tax=Streblomastix strix TaxID=222440 RepID=A0A5J4WQ13_9EUKA|nr:MAG: hypothetical protein EZS28_007513 [Streblomastix strix]
MAKILIVYFTRGGATKFVADQLSDDLAKGGVTVEREEVKSAQVKLGWWEYLKNIWGILTGWKYVIDVAPINKPADYDAVIFGTAVWCSKVSGPLNEWLSQQTFDADSKTIYGSFAQAGGRGHDGVHAQIESIVKKPLAAKQSTLEKETKGDGTVAKEKTAEFAKTILKALGIEVAGSTEEKKVE